MTQEEFQSLWDDNFQGRRVVCTNPLSELHGQELEISGLCGSEILYGWFKAISYEDCELLPAVFYCRDGCGATVDNYRDKCPDCKAKFNAVCGKYRLMKKSVDGESEKEQLNAINNFRCGY